MAVRFDAAADRLSHAGAYPQTSAGITITAWARIDVDRNDWSTFLRLSDSGTVVTFATDSDGQLGPQAFTAVGSAQFGSGNMPVGTWVPIALTRSASTGDITTWRQLAAGTTTTATVNLATTDVTGTPTNICLGGRSAGDATEWLNGSLAYVRVWSTELTQSEIEAEWASTTPVRTSNLHSDWPLSQGEAYADTVAAKVLTVASGGQLKTANGPLLPSANLSTNPCGDVDTTGWVGAVGIGSATNNETAGTARTTGLLAAGFPKDTGFKWTNSGGFVRSAPAPVTAGQTYTISFWGSSTDIAGFNKLQTCYVVWYNADGSDNSYNNFGSFHGAGHVNGLPYRKIGMTNPAPAGTVAVGIIVDGGLDCVVSLVQVEPGSTQHDYADGDTAGWQWDGTTGKSTSQPATGGSITGALAGSLPSPITGQLAGVERIPGALAGSLPSPITGQLAGVETIPGALAGSLPAPLAGQLAGVERITGQLAGSLPSPLGGRIIDDVITVVYPPVFAAAGVDLVVDELVAAAGVDLVTDDLHASHGEDLVT